MMSFIPKQPEGVIFPRDVFDAAKAVCAGFFTGHRELYVTEIAAAIMAERERAAVVADEFASLLDTGNRRDVALVIAAAIRKGA